MVISQCFRSGASQDVRDERSLQAQGEYRGNRCKRKEQCLRDNQPKACDILWYRYVGQTAIVGANGVESDIPIELNGEEALKLKESADALKSILDGLEL